MESTSGPVRHAQAASWYPGIVIFLLSLAINLAMVFVVFQAQSFVSDKFDPYYFGKMGQSLARGDGFAQYGLLLKRRSPLYPLLIGGIYFLFGDQPRLVQLLQCVLLAGTCWMVFDMGRRVSNLRTGIVAGVMCAFHPIMLRYVADLHLETLLTFLFTLTVWCTVRFYFRPTVANGVLLGSAGAAAALTKAVVVLYPALFVFVWLAIRLVRPGASQQPGPPLAAIAAIAGAMAILIAPWTIRNFRATNGHFVLITTGFSDAFLRGYIFSKTDYALLRRPPYTDAENESNAWFQSLARDAGTEWEKDDYETEQILGRAARQKLLSEPGAFVRKFAIGLFTFWYEMTSLENSLVTGVLAAGAWLLALMGTPRAWREGRPIWLLLLPAIHLNLILAVLLALGRYSAPVIPALLVASAFGVDTLLGRSRRAHG
jgi:4-amino-4-deoxy-L-arabinose transferase-like glycosyltransferase